MRVFFGKFPMHSVEIEEIFCHSDFYVKLNLEIFDPQKNVILENFRLNEFWATEKLLNPTVCNGIIKSHLLMTNNRETIQSVLQ